MLCKQKICAVFLSTALLFNLSGCVSNEDNIEKTSSKIMKMYSDLSQFETNIKFLCDSGESILEYDCEFEYNKDYGQTLTIDKPESLSGITIHSTGTNSDNINISYEDTVLDFDTSKQHGTSPADFMPNLIVCLSSSSADEIWSESQHNQKLLVARYENKTNDTNITTQIWLYKDTLSPMYAEIYQDGERVLQSFFSEFKTS